MALIAAVVLMTSLAGAAPAVATQANPQELWDAYPLDPGQAGPRIRLPEDSATPRPKVRATATPTRDGGASTPLLVGIGVGALAFGAVAGLWLRRPRSATAPALATASAAGLPDATAPARRPAPPSLPAPPPLEPAPVPRAPVPAVPTHARAPRPAPSQRPAVPPPPPPTAEPRPSAGRFQRVAWPDGAEGRWRCEIVRRYGLVHADFRAMVLAPGQRRPAEISRTRTFPRPGWGNDEPYEEMAAKVQALALVLREAGWEPVGLGREWFAVRFVWPRAGAPVLDALPSPVPVKEPRP